MENYNKGQQTMTPRKGDFQVKTGNQKGKEGQTSIVTETEKGGSHRLYGTRQCSLAGKQAGVRRCELRLGEPGTSQYHG